MAYDAARGEVVLFGGYDYTFLTSVLLNDTWVWNGTAWTQRSSTTATIPAPRIAHGMTYDALRGEVVMFGGYDSDPLNDTWVWNGATWTIHAGAGPTARSGHAMAYDAARAELVLFGGRNNGEKNDTWRWH
jgi:hypothetical protein